MFLLYEYDSFGAFLIISSLVPILEFFISGILAPISKGPKKLSSYDSGIEPMGDAWFLCQPLSTSEIPTETFFKYKSSVPSHELVN